VAERKRDRQDKGRTGRLKPADPFDLIRWLARSQSDPRKALAELVQNSLDAGASEIHVVRARDKGLTCLRILDNGSGVLPQMGRIEALEYLATHIGQSLKQRLSVQERHELMMQGKYGIGILGFWSLGERFEIVSHVGGEELQRLVLWEDRPTYRIEPAQGRLDRDVSWTEVVVRGLHRAALPALSGRRVQEYLASELRGQLQRRPVRLTVTDKLARGRALRHFRVQPRRFQGQLLTDLPPLTVPSYGAASVELYLVPSEAPRGHIALAGQGTVVVDDLASLEGFDLAHPPWDSGQLDGIIDFPHLEVAPGSRRGMVPNAAAVALCEALERYAPLVTERLEQEHRRQAAALETNLLKELKRILREMPQALPQYDFFPLLRPKDLPLAGESEAAAGGEAVAVPEPLSEPGTVDLLPAGPLEQVVLWPARAQVLMGADRSLIARALDRDGRRLGEGVSYRWECAAACGNLEALEGGRAVFHAGYQEGAATIEVIAEVAERTARAAGSIEVVSILTGGRGDRGIPEPDLVSEPLEEWRSRVREERWEVNSGHADFQATAANPKLRLRYILSLLAKEVVLRSFGGPEHARLLEKLVEVLAFAERHLART
jgi:hypothetical protein